jgi:Ni,Fe-hydrogenase III small subunit
MIISSSMYGKWLSNLVSKRSLATEVVAPIAYEDDELSPVRVHLRGSLQIRHIDAGSCNGCELEIASIFSPVYDAEQYGIRLVASPRHADAALITGPVTKNMIGPLTTTVAALASHSVVIALGDCARDCGVFAGAYAVEGSVTDVTRVTLEIPGCPPAPKDIVAALRRLSGS